MGRQDFESHVYEDDYGIEISTNETEKDHTISVNTAEEVKSVMDACKKWVRQFKPELFLEEVDLSANEKIKAYEKNIGEYITEIQSLQAENRAMRNFLRKNRDWMIELKNAGDHLPEGFNSILKGLDALLKGGKE